MSILDQVRAKFQIPVSAASKTSTGTPVCVQTSMVRNCKTSETPSAGFEVPLHTRLNAENSISGPFLSPEQETARADVLAQLEANPSVQRAFTTRFLDDGTLVVTLAIRGIGTCELKIPADRFNRNSLDDYAALINCIGAPNDRA